MSGLEIEWPDAMAERVRAARSRLVQAGQALRARPLEDRLQAVARVVESWTRPDSPWRRELAEGFGQVGPFHPTTVADGLDAALRAWDPDRLVSCARRELSDVLTPGSRTLAPYDWTAVLAGGSIPMPTLLSSLLPLVLGSPVLLRETSKDPVTGGLLARSIAEHDRELARSFESLAIPTEDAAAFDSLLEAPCVVATGSDETMRSLAARLDGRQRFVAYGHRFSIGIAGSEAPGRVEGISEGFALDIARWDQSGCLSPVVIYLLGVEPSAQAAFAGGLARALERLGERMPRGPAASAERAVQATERSEARMRAASGSGLLFEGDDYTVVLESDARPRPAPLQRFVRVMPITSIQDLDRAVAPFSGHLATVAVEGVSPQDEPSLRRRLSRFGVSRFTSAGRMQTPPIDWPRDGLPLLSPMARFVLSD